MQYIVINVLPIKKAINSYRLLVLFVFFASESPTLHLIVSLKFTFDNSPDTIKSGYCVKHGFSNLDYRLVQEPQYHSAFLYSFLYIKFS